MEGVRDWAAVGGIVGLNEGGVEGDNDSVVVGEREGGEDSVVVGAPDAKSEGGED